jgi:hypothetical protein
MNIIVIVFTFLQFSSASKLTSFINSFSQSDVAASVCLQQLKLVDEMTANETPNWATKSSFRLL